MTTWQIQIAPPASGTTNNSVGQAAFVDSGLDLDDSVTGAGILGSLLDDHVGSTAAIKLGKLLAEMQRADKRGRQYRAFDGAVTYVKPTL